MKSNIGPVIVIVVTVLLSMALFLLNDNSGIAVTDVVIEEHNDTIGLNHVGYYLRVGRHFDYLDVNYRLFSNNEVFSSGHSDIFNVSMGTYEVETDKFNSTSVPDKIEIVVYFANIGENDTSDNFEVNPKPLYNKTFNITT